MSIKPALLAALALAACKKSAGPEMTFGNCMDRTSTFIGNLVTCAKPAQGDLEVRFAVRGTDLLTEMESYETGTKLSFGSSSSEKLIVPIADKLKGISLKQVLGSEPIDLGLTISYDSPRYVPMKLTLPPIKLGCAYCTSDSAEALLVKEKAGLGAAAPAKRSIFVASEYIDAVIGDATSLADIDWVALPSYKEEKDTEQCQYETEKGAEAGKATMADVFTVKIVDRRTGSVVDTKEFTATGECPSSLSSTTTLRFRFDNAKAWEPIKQWLVEKQST